MLGDADGATLGNALGAALGVALGDVVGTDVGSGVGLCDGTVHTIVRRTSSSAALAVGEMSFTPNVNRLSANNVHGTVRVTRFLSGPALSKVTAVLSKVPDPLPASMKLPTSM